MFVIYYAPFNGKGPDGSGRKGKMSKKSSKSCRVSSAGVAKVGGTDFRIVAESYNHGLAVSADGTLLTPSHMDGTYRGVDNGHGYKVVRFTHFDTGETVVKYVHRLVFEMFVGPISDDLEIDHINGDRSDNRLSNLRVVSHSENQRNPMTVGKLIRHLDLVRGAANEALRKRVVGVSASSGNIVEFASCKDAAEFAGVTMPTVTTSLKSDRANKKTAGGYKWFYACDMEVS